MVRARTAAGLSATPSREKALILPSLPIPPALQTGGQLPRFRSRGTVSLFGRQLPKGRADVLRRVGSMVESPSPYLHLTGRENLEVHTRLLGLPPRGIDEALDMVNLLPVRDRLVRHYSTGMKQRLGIAAALLGNPDLLVLDEPTNGLDPAGIFSQKWSGNLR